MTTKCLHNKKLHFQNFIVVSFPMKKKNSILDDFPLCPLFPPPPLKNANCYFYCRLAISENSEHFWQACSDLQNKLFRANFALGGCHPDDMSLSWLATAEPQSIDIPLRDVVSDLFALVKLGGSLHKGASIKVEKTHFAG